MPDPLPPALPLPDQGNPATAVSLEKGLSRWGRRAKRQGLPNIPHRTHRKPTNRPGLGFPRARLISVHSPGAAREVSKHPEFGVVRGPRGDSPAESASGHRALRSPARSRIAHDPGRVAERGRLCGIALRSPRALRGHFVPRPAGARRAPIPTPAYLLRPPRGPARAASSRVVRRSETQRVVPPPLAHTCRAARRPAPVPPRGATGPRLRHG